MTPWPLFVGLVAGRDVDVDRPINRARGRNLREVDGQLRRLEVPGETLVADDELHRFTLIDVRPARAGVDRDHLVHGVFRRRGPAQQGGALAPVRQSGPREHSGRYGTDYGDKAYVACHVGFSCSWRGRRPINFLDRQEHSTSRLFYRSWRASYIFVSRRKSPSPCL